MQQNIGPPSLGQNVLTHSESLVTSLWLWAAPAGATVARVEQASGRSVRFRQAQGIGWGLGRRAPRGYELPLVAYRVTSASM